MTWISLLPGFPCDWDLPVNRVRDSGNKDCRSIVVSAGGRHRLPGLGCGPAVPRDPGAAHSLPLPSPAHCPSHHHSTKPMRNVFGADGAWRKNRRQWGPFAVPELPSFQGMKQQKRPLRPGVALLPDHLLPQTPGALGKVLHGIGNSAWAGWDPLQEWDLPDLQQPPSRARFTSREAVTHASYPCSNYC